MVCILPASWPSSVKCRYQLLVGIPTGIGGMPTPNIQLSTPHGIPAPKRDQGPIIPTYWKKPGTRHTIYRRDGEQTYPSANI